MGKNKYLNTIIICISIVLIFEIFILVWNTMMKTEASSVPKINNVIEYSEEAKEYDENLGTGLIIDLENFDTSSVQDFSNAFYNTAFTALDLTGMVTSSATNLSNMFAGCTDLEKIYASDNFVTTGVSTSTNMFDDCEIL